MVTKCKHHFCEGCALKHFQTSRRCFVCAEQTSGIFNKAKEIQEKIVREAAAAARLAEAGVTCVADDDEKAAAAYQAARSLRKARAGFGWAFK